MNKQVRVRRLLLALWVSLIFPLSVPTWPEHARADDVALDVDGNGVGDALTDGILILRSLFQFTGEALVGGGAVASDCTRCTADEIQSVLREISLDVDGDGFSDALTDGILILRFLFQFSGDSLTGGGVVGAGCTRCTAEAIEAFLQGSTDDSPAQLSCETPDCATEITAKCGDKLTFETRITCSHNVVRDYANPAPVQPLPSLVYSLDLAAIAQGWADTCATTHNPNPSFNGMAAGENSAFFSSTLGVTVAAESAVKLWASEQEFYDVSINFCSSGVCGHYKQLVWNSTTLLGCGIATGCGSQTGFETHVVCNYSPPGNFIGEAPYTPE